MESVENNFEITINDVVNNVYLKFQKSYTIEQIQNLMNLTEITFNKPDAYIISVYYTITTHDFKINDIYKYTPKV